MIEKFCMVDVGLRSEIDELIADCSGADGFKLELYTDASINVYKDMEFAFTVREGGLLCGILCVFAPTKHEVEINALVHPSRRRQGYFKALLSSTAEVCRQFGYSRGFLFCNEASAEALQIMSHWKHTLDHIEYQMQFDITAPAPAADTSIRLEKLAREDIPEIAPLMAECFGQDREREEIYLTNSLGSAERTNWVLRGSDNEVIGFCGEYREGCAWNVFGLGIVPAERRKGYARKMLDLIAGMAAGQGMDMLRLDVDSCNPNAISLYQSYGFFTLSATRYYAFEF